MTGTDVGTEYAADWRYHDLGPTTIDERRLLAAILPVPQESTSSRKWTNAARVLATYLEAPETDVGGIGISNAVQWRKHRHNRAGQNGFIGCPVSIFVADDNDVIAPVIADYHTAILNPDSAVESAVLVVRRDGAIAGGTVDDAGRTARVVSIVSSPSADNLERLKALAPGAALDIVDVGDRAEELDRPGTQRVDRHTLLAEAFRSATCWILLQSDRSEYSDIEGASYHYLRTTRASGELLKPGDWVLCLRASDSRKADQGRLFGLARIGRVHKKGHDRYAVYDLYWPAPTAVTFPEVGGDPRPTPQNPMTRVEPQLLLHWAEAAGLADIESMWVPELALSLETLRRETENLVLPAGTLESCLAATRGGKHLLLTGPPGTGKSTLAIALARAAEADGIAGAPSVTTGTADWTSVETVGAYRLERDSGGLVFTPGHFLDAIARDSWLVIDELNRADIDKAVGQLFSVLSGHAVVLPYDDGDGKSISVVPAEASVPDGTTSFNLSPHWRLIATMNERDRDLLFTLSEAFMRRFAVVRIGPPETEAQWLQALSSAGVNDQELLRTATQIAMVDGLSIGPAVIQDCARFVSHRLAVEYESTAAGVGIDHALHEAVRLLVEPQLAGHFEDDRDRILRDIDAIIDGLSTSVDDTDTSGEASLPDGD